MQRRYNPSINYLYKLKKELAASQSNYIARPDHPAFVSAPLEELQEEASVALYLSSDYPAYVDRLHQQEHTCPVTTLHHIKYDINDLWNLEEHFRLQTDVARATGLAPIPSIITRNQQHLVDQRGDRFALYRLKRITATPRRISTPPIDDIQNTVTHRYPLLHRRTPAENVSTTTGRADVGRDLER
jgi:hypothetical protein